MIFSGVSYFSKYLPPPACQGEGDHVSGGRGHLKMVNDKWRKAPWRIIGRHFLASCGSRPLPSRFARHPPPKNGGGQVSIVAGSLFSP